MVLTKEVLKEEVRLAQIRHKSPTPQQIPGIASVAAPPTAGLVRPGTLSYFLAAPIFAHSAARRA